MEASTPSMRQTSSSGSGNAHMFLDDDFTKHSNPTLQAPKNTRQQSFDEEEGVFDTTNENSAI